MIRYLIIIVSVIILLIILNKKNKTNIKIKGNLVEKFFLKKPAVSIDEQVRINNNSNLSPKIFKWGENYLIMERMDYSLKEMIYKLKLKQYHVKKLILLLRKLDKYKYSHNDLHWKNIMWSEKYQDFKVIDWEYSTLRLVPTSIIEDDMDFLKEKIDDIAFNLPKKERDLGFNLLKNIYLGKSNLESIKLFYLFLLY